MPLETLFKFCFVVAVFLYFIVVRPLWNSPKKDGGMDK